VIDGVGSALAGRKDSDLAAQRDSMVLDMLRAKAVASDIP
jgi:hypothetical protein